MIRKLVMSRINKDFMNFLDYIDTLSVQERFEWSFLVCEDPLYFPFFSSFLASQNKFLPADLVAELATGFQRNWMSLVLKGADPAAPRRPPVPEVFPDDLVAIDEEEPADIEEYIDEDWGCDDDVDDYYDDYGFDVDDGEDHYQDY